MSFNIIYKNITTQSVNSTTSKYAPQKSMSQLGFALERIINTLGKHFNLSKPFMFTKADIKDGFWRLVVSESAAWNFCYTLPPTSSTTTIDDIDIVVPTSLQMGWTESPPYFSAASETARDVIEWLETSPTPLQPHPLEHHMCDNTTPPTITKGNVDINEVYVDDFIGGTNNLEATHLAHLARAILHGIHSIFPPPSITGHQGEDPISIKKLSSGEGKWSFEKEILGWTIDGKNFTIFLEKSKTQKIITTIKKVTKQKSITLKNSNNSSES